MLHSIDVCQHLFRANPGLAQWTYKQSGLKAGRRKIQGFSNKHVCSPRLIWLPPLLSTLPASRSALSPGYTPHPRATSPPLGGRLIHWILSFVKGQWLGLIAMNAYFWCGFAFPVHHVSDDTTIGGPIKCRVQWICILYNTAFDQGTHSHQK